MNITAKLISENPTRHPLNLHTDGGEATIYLYDVIDPMFGISAMGFVDAIKSIGNVETLNIRINSPGGDVFEARAIVEAIKRFEGKTVAHIDGLSASSATTIACAADDVAMAEGALYMIHNASAFVYGDKNQMLEMAALLEKVEGAIINDYVSKTGLSDKEIADFMDAETWFTSAKALENKFVNRISDTANKNFTAKNVWNLSAYKNAPKIEKKKEPEITGAFMKAANTNRLRLAQIL